MADESDYDFDVWNAAKPLLAALTISGSYFNNRQESTCLRAVKISYCLLVHISLWINVGRIIWCIGDFQSVDGNVLMNSSFAVFIISFSVCSTASAFSMSTGLRKVIDAIQNLHTKYGISPYTRNPRKRLRRYVVVSSIFNSLFGVGALCFIAMSEEAKSGRMCFMAPFKGSEPIAYYSFLSFFLISSIWHGLSFSSMINCFWVICYVICHEFSANAATMGKYLRLQGNEISADNVEKARLQYEDIVKLVRKCNRLFSSYLLVFYGMVTPFMCMIVYAIVTEHYTPIFTFQAVTDIILVVVGALALTKAGVLVTNKAHMLTDSILRTDFSRYPEEVSRSLSVFLCRLTRTKVGLSGGGLFFVDAPLLLTIAGLIATYTVVVFQFRFSHKSNMFKSGNTTMIPEL